TGMGQGGLFGKLFGRKGTGVGSRADTPPASSASPPRHDRPQPRVQDAVPQPVTARWDQDEALRHLLGDAAEVVAVMQVLDLCDTLRGPTPPTSWREEMAALLDDNAAGVDALRTIALRETPFDDPEADHRVSFARAVVWAIGLTEPGEAVALLVRVADLYGAPGRGRDYRSVALSAVEALGRIGGERALPALREIKAQAKLGAVRRAASQELDQILGEENLSRADVPEWQAEDFELDRDGVRVIELDRGYAATIELAVDGTVTWFYRSPAGQRLPNKPTSLRADRAREAVDLAGNLQTVVYAERFRLKQLMQDQRTLTYEDWMEFYLGNRVTGRLCRALVWESSIDGGEHWRRFLPAWSTHREAWLRLGEDGVSHDIAEESQARIVLPKHITPAETRAWAARLRALRFTQPFKQLDLRR
ncbi:DUF4132 domain-containing protein, partial [Catenulispora rubra]|uniref:DUF4132 domain-containing protein n=1 Tax=Catenulispora rubra TaxID=280293 RepID=UPI001E3F7609